jgi:hypothetical protein
MGVQTKLFGPHAWRVLESLAASYDAQPEDLRRELFGVVVRLFEAVGDILPCVYCRRSYVVFAADVGIARTLANLGARYLVWYFHMRVNQKLRAQELAEEAGDGGDDSATHAWWVAYDLSLSAALARTPQALSSKGFWDDYVMLLGYVVCDYSRERADAVLAFLQCTVGILLALGTAGRGRKVRIARIGASLQRALANIRGAWASSDSVHRAYRFDIVWALKKHVYDAAGWRLRCNALDIDLLCSKGIVACEGPGNTKCE